MFLVLGSACADARADCHGLGFMLFLLDFIEAEVLTHVL